MNNFPTDADNAENVGNNPDQEPIAEYVSRMETDENLEKLAGKMQQEWEKSRRTRPDLSFEKFMNKMKGTDDQ